MSIASLFLLGVLALLLFVDYATLRKRGARVVLIELVIFTIGGVMVAVPEISQRLAAMVGIGRGVDFVLYPTIIWLVRESILSRHVRWEESERITELVRVLSIANAQRRSEPQ